MIPMIIGRIKSLKINQLGSLAALKTRSTLLENWHIKIVKASLTGVCSEY